MKPAFALLPLFTIGAIDGDAAERPVQPEHFVFETAPVKGELRPTMPNPGLIYAERCDDYIRQVRRERGLPELRREPAQPGDGALWSAVDRRVNGCPVLTRHGDPDDIRPFPAPQRGPLFRRIPVGEK